MALTKKRLYQVEITETDHVQVRTNTQILEDGEVISSAYHRHVIAPGQDASGEKGKVRRAVAAAHVATAVALHQAQQAVNQARRAVEQDNTAPNRQALQDARTARNTARTAHQAFLDNEDP